MSTTSMMELKDDPNVWLLSREQAYLIASEQAWRRWRIRPIPEWLFCWMVGVPYCPDSQVWQWWVDQSDVSTFAAAGRPYGILLPSAGSGRSR